MKNLISFLSKLVGIVIVFSAGFYANTLLLPPETHRKKTEYVCSVVREHIRRNHCRCKGDRSLTFLNPHEEYLSQAGPGNLRDLSFKVKENVTPPRIRDSSVEGRPYLTIDSQDSIVDFGFNRKP